MNRKDRRAAKRKGDPLASPMAATLVSAFRAHQAGDRAVAERLYRDVLAVEPRNAPALHLLGAFMHQGGHSDQAISLIRQAIAIEPKNVDYHYNLGSILHGDGRTADAIEHLSKAVALKPGYAEAHFELGNALAREGRLDESEKSLRRALDLQPGNAGAMNNLGRVLRAMNRSDEAAALWQRAVTLQPKLAIAHLNIGKVHHEQNRLAEAEDSLRRALDIDSDYAEATLEIAFVLIEQDKTREAISLVSEALAAHDTAMMKATFIRCLLADQTFSPDASLRDPICRALQEGWCAPIEIAPYCISLLKADPLSGAAIARVSAEWGEVRTAQILPTDAEIEDTARDRLFRAYLEAAPNVDIEIERFLTVLRAAVLDRAVRADETALSETALDFVAALARQCFINEYVFGEFGEERAHLRQLLKAVDKAIRDHEPLPAIQLAALAAYRPLYEVEGAVSLLERTWPASVRSLLRQQIAEPQEEAELRLGIPALTAFDDAAAADENDLARNPSPRWVKATSTHQLMSVQDFVRFRLPETQIPPIELTGSPEILIAGCGTGLQAINAAHLYRDARILAVDVSMPNLAYAARQARDLGLPTIEFARAEIPALTSIGRTFDVIESSGVLDHLAAPLAAWSALISLLRDGGVMKIGFRSERVHRDIAAAKDLARHGNYQADAEGIRTFRQNLLRLPPDDPALKATLSGDFYATGTCRDLFSPAHDHALTLLDIQAFVAQSGIEVVGIESTLETRRAFAARFPDARARADLAAWHAFERDNPDLMPAICQLWLRKPPR